MSIRFVAPKEVERIRAGVRDRHRRCAAVADACRINTLSMIMYAGSGHVGSSFSTMDLLCWLWTEVLDRPAARASEDGDIYFSSKGHDAPGLYAVLIGLGKLDATYLTKLRRLHGLPGHPDVSIPYMITNTGPLGMGISKARGIVTADRLDGRRRRIFVVTGDGELQEGQFWESLQPTANGRFDEITVLVDHNKIQSDTFVEEVSDLGDFAAKVRSFGWEVARCDGHDPAAIESALADLARATGRPRMLIADTLKGRGVSFMEPSAVGADRLYRFHSGAPSREHYEAAIEEIVGRVNGVLRDAGQSGLVLDAVEDPSRVVPRAPERLVGAYASELVALGERRRDIVALDGDLALDCGLLPFKAAFPDRFVECGIAEQDMVSQAGGLALHGKLPIVHSFACFLSTRANEQIYNNATERTKVIYHASLAGLLPAAPGHSHQSVRDISVVGSVPDLTLIQPCNEHETRLALRWAVDENSASTYLRLVSVPCDVPYRLPDGYALEVGRGCVLKPGTDGVVIAYGPVMLAQAYEAANLLEARGRSLAVVNLPWLNRVDSDWLARTVAGHRRLFLIEDHYVSLGQSAFVTAALQRSGTSIPTRVYGVDGIPECGQPAETLEHHGLSAARLAERMWAEP